MDHARPKVGGRYFGDEVHWRPHLEEHRRSFEVYGNPLHAWRAYALCRRHGLALPDWLLRYFDDAAQVLIDSIFRSRRSGDKIDAVVIAALKFTSGNAFRKTRNADIHAIIGIHITRLLSEGHKLTQAYDKVAQLMQIGRTTVVDAYAKYRRIHPSNQ